MNTIKKLLFSDCPPFSLSLDPLPNLVLVYLGYAAYVRVPDKMRLVYNLVFTVLFFLSTPYYFLKMWRRGNWKAGFGQRFSLYSPELKKRLSEKPVVWFHAVSVGEVGVCIQLLKILAPKLADYQLVVSTTTSTGMGELQSKLPESILKIYYPVDFYFGVRHTLDIFRPRAIVLIEAEFWPNLLWQALDRQIPLFLVNARVSDRSYAGYKRAKFLFGPIFRHFSMVGSQNESDVQRLKILGFPEPVIHNVGNLKFDAALPQKSPGQTKPGLDVRALLQQVGVAETAQLLVCGSTHAGEEALLAAMFQRLKRQFSELFLVLVPRHFERAKDVAEDLKKTGLQFAFRSEITTETRLASGSIDCLLVNTTGELKSFYQHATLVFVGKSLTAIGGQNPIEPAALGKAMVFGPNMQNFKSVVASLLKGQGAIQVQNEVELEKTFAELLSNTSRRKTLGDRGLQVVEKMKGATQRTVDLMIPLITKS